MIRRVVMKRRSKFATAAIMLLLVISLSLNIVSAVNQTAVPGSDQDPIVSKSYVDAAIEQLSAQIKSLQKANDELKATLTDQEKQIKTLQDEIKMLKSGTTAASSTSTGTSSSTTTPQTGSSGKTNGGTTAKTDTQTTSQVKGVVNVAVLNLRSKPTTSSSILGKLYKNETLTIISESNGWCNVVTSKGVKGYVFSTYVTKKK